MMGGFINVYDGIRYLVLFVPENYDAIYNSNRYLTSEKSAIADITNHNFARNRIDSFNSLPIEKSVDS